ncbi:hypothetical protein, partial [Ruminococcus bromii]|uniref:hypothetical protein n=1 Tax=Ruminococcus bromii TaxID=40518 RepID=UPI00265D7033
QILSIFLKSKYFSHKTKRATKNEVLNFFPPQAAVARLPQVPSYSLLQFVIAVTASDGDCYMSNFRPRQCGLFIVILSSTLSLKTVHRTVFLTVAFKSRYKFACKTKKQNNKKVNLF